MKKKILALILGVFSLSLAGFSPVFAQNATQSLIPEEVPGQILDCIKFMKLSSLKEHVKEDQAIDADGLFYDDKGNKITGVPQGGTLVPARDTALTCGIKSGRIPLWLIPFYIVRVIDFLILFGGMIAVLFMVIGGYHMIIGSYSEEKEKGKNTIKYSLMGLVLSLLAYTIVNVVLLFLTS